MSFFSFFNKKLDVQKRFILQKAAISGTMSKFYQAVDRKTNQTVGLKILDTDKMKAVEDRYKKYGKAGQKPSEGEISMMFEHPYIVKTFEQGLTTANEPYLIMEYLEGTGLNNILLIKQDLLAGGRLNYIRQCAEALDAVHDKGFIHRDYCPRNLLFTGDGTALKLIDFGLTVPNKFPFTEPGVRTGTANYMAPELVRRKPTDQRVDVFAFGVTMYEMCTRELPWPRGQSGGLSAMAHDQPAAPILNYKPNLDPILAQAIHKCMEPDPHNRFSSMKEFLKFIRRVENEEIEAD
ncbi:MAG: serine/threonine-protein kinase [Planctomycetia bacterium]|nr:serine/threonine-protein kinase [Planctomycetia bacterium]